MCLRAFSCVKKSKNNVMGWGWRVLSPGTRRPPPLREKHAPPFSSIIPRCFSLSTGEGRGTPKKKPMSLHALTPAAFVDAGASTTEAATLVADIKGVLGTSPGAGPPEV